MAGLPPMTFLALACAIIVVPFIFGSMIFGMERTLWAWDWATSPSGGEY